MHRQLSTSVLSKNLFISKWMKCFFHDYSPEPCYPIPNKSPKKLSAQEALSIVKSGNYLILCVILIIHLNKNFVLFFFR